MRDQAFQRDLEAADRSATGKPLSKRVVADYVSRCRRVEQMLGCDLDGVADLPERVAIRIESKAIGLSMAGVRSLQTAMRRYFEFRHGPRR
jgi:hypothetical protein